MPTDAALLASGSKPTCTYYRMDHSSNACKTVTSISARKEILKKVGRCFICLKRNHISKDCSSRMKCLNAGVSSMAVFVQATLTMTSSLYIPQMLRDQLLYLGAKLHAALWESLMEGPQFCVSMHQRPSFFRQPRRQFSDLKFLARLILDSGSQRSYVTTRVKDKLRLPSERN